MIYPIVAVAALCSIHTSSASAEAGAGSGSATQREADEIKHLPGWDSELPSRQYSGFINITGSEGVTPANEMMVHYYYVESENVPNTDPLILWTNGGNVHIICLMSLYIYLTYIYLHHSNTNSHLHT
jgi:carboxypeptidase C (cathepsin A)